MQKTKKEISLQYLLGRIVGKKHLIFIPVRAHPAIIHRGDLHYPETI